MIWLSLRILFIYLFVGFLFCFFLSLRILDDPFSFNFIFHCAEVDDAVLNNMTSMAESHILVP